MALLAGTKLGPYEIIAPIGAGGMGEVYKATDTRLDRIVAIKVLPEHLSGNVELKQRFEREARAVSSLNHPNICTLHDVGDENGVDFMVMEYIEGETLTERLKKGALPLGEALQHGIEIADALDKAHREGVVHRDVKPGNVMVTKPGLKLLDFGLATQIQPGFGGQEPLSAAPTEDKPLTREGAILGTLQYMSPEQLEGKEVDARTDVFAFGAVLYEMVTGRKAFTGGSQASLISAIMTSEPPAPSTLVPLSPRMLDQVIRKCLEKDPDDRWQSLADIVHLLHWIVARGHEELGASPTVAPGKSWLAWAMAGAFLLTTLVLGIARLRDEPEAAVTTRFDIVAPEGSIVEPSFAAVVGLALSPDGRRLVFEAQDADGVDKLWLRPLESLESRVLPGTEGGQFPFWSPDSRSIAFFADRKLKKLEIDGGRIDTLCDAGDGAGGSWSEEGVILFSPRLERNLLRVSDAGGVPQPVTSLGADVSGHYWPTFLPDGRRYLFQVLGETGAGIDMGSLDSIESQRILELESVSELTSVAYVPGGGGYLLFMRSGVLMAQAFDLDRIELLGEPVPVAEGVARRASGWASFSVSANGVLAYGLEGVPRTTELLWLDRNGGLAGHAGAPARYGSVSLSPDGERLAVTQWDGDWDIWFVDTLRGTSTLFPGQNERHAYDIVWSPDESRIVFALDQDGPPNLHMRLADGSGKAERLFRSPLETEPADWSPDGQLIVFEQRQRETGWDIGIVPVDPVDGDRVPRMLLQTESEDRDPRFSPDGRYLAYVSDESGQNQVYVVRFPELDQKQRISVGGGEYPRWPREGRELFFVAPGGKLMAAEVTTAPSFEANVPRLLFERSDVHTNPTVGGPYDVTPDGQRIVMNVAVGEEPTPQPITVVLNWMAELKR